MLYHHLKNMDFDRQKIWKRQTILCLWCADEKQHRHLREAVIFLQARTPAGFGRKTAKNRLLEKVHNNTLIIKAIISCSCFKPLSLIFKNRFLLNSVIVFLKNSLLLDQENTKVASPLNHRLVTATNSQTLICNIKVNHL